MAHISGQRIALVLNDCNYFSQEKEAMKLLIDMLLSKVAFREAQFVSTVFSTATEEYQLAVSCVQLAEGVVVPDSIPTQLKDQLESDAAKKGPRVSHAGAQVFHSFNFCS